MDSMVISVLVSGLIQIVGLILNSNLTKWRIAELEKKVDKHNNLIERTAVLEQSAKAAHHRLDELFEEVKEVNK